MDETYRDDPKIVSETVLPVSTENDVGGKDAIGLSCMTPVAER